MRDSALQRIQMSDQREGILTTDRTACFSLAREMRRVHVIARFTITGEPASKARPRFNGLGYVAKVYTPAKTKEAELRIAWLFRAATSGHQPDKTKTYGVAAVFFSGTRQRRDVDNMLKLICDGLNGVAWVDDAQVEEISGRRGHDLPSEARTEVLIYETGCVDPPPQITCAGCGTQITTYESWPRRKYCTRECGVEHRRSLRVRVCKHCGKEFDNDSAADRQFCSKGCAYAAHRVTVACAQCGAEFTKPRSLNKGKPFCTTDCRAAYFQERRTASAKGQCLDCGGSTSKKTYTRCRSCNTKHRTGATPKYVNGQRVPK